MYVITADHRKKDGCATRSAESRLDVGTKNVALIISYLYTRWWPFWTIHEGVFSATKGRVYLMIMLSLKEAEWKSVIVFTDELMQQWYWAPSKSILYDWNYGQLAHLSFVSWSWRLCKKKKQIKNIFDWLFSFRCIWIF